MENDLDEVVYSDGDTPLVPTNQWVTKDGRRIPVSELGSNHLFNAIRLARRTAAYNMAVEDWNHYELDVALSDKDWHSSSPAPNEGVAINDWLAARLSVWEAMVAEVAKRGGSWHTALTNPSDSDLILWATLLVLQAYKASRE